MEQADKIEKAIAKLWEREKDATDAFQAAAEAEGAYRIAKAEAFLKADGTDKNREAESLVAVKEKYLAKVRAEAIAELTKQKLQDVRQVISARQSILSAEAKVHELTKYKIA